MSTLRVSRESVQCVYFMMWTLPWSPQWSRVQTQHKRRHQRLLGSPFRGVARTQSSRPTLASFRTVKCKYPVVAPCMHSERRWRDYPPQPSEAISTHPLVARDIIVSALETQTSSCYRGCSISLFFFLFFISSSFPLKFALASLLWKQARSTWNCNTSLNSRSNIFFRQSDLTPLDRKITAVFSISVRHPLRLRGSQQYCCPGEVFVFEDPRGFILKFLTSSVFWSPVA